MASWSLKRKSFYLLIALLVLVVFVGIPTFLRFYEAPTCTDGKQNAEAFDVPYVFKLRDEKNLLVYERKGRLYIPPKTVFPVFESGIVTGERDVARAFFELENVSEWHRTDEIPNAGLRLGERTFTGASTT